MEAGRRSELRIAATRSLVRVLGVSLFLSLLGGGGSALLAWSLNAAGAWSRLHPVSLILLPLVAALSAFFYARWGVRESGGNESIVEAIRDSEANAAHHAGPRARMTPLIFLGTALSHAAGASVGREGSAVQMAAGMATLWPRAAGPRGILPRAEILRAAMAAGFASIFGAPLAAILFAYELPRGGQKSIRSLRDRGERAACVAMSAVGADLVARRCGIAHHDYASSLRGFAVGDLASTAHLTLIFSAVAIACAMAAILYRQTLARFSHSAAQLFPSPTWRGLAVGALAALALSPAAAAPYRGLGLDSLAQTFAQASSPAAWALKLLFTVLCLGAGLRGGEVTPLFFMGASLGSAVAGWVGWAPAPFAAMGFAALFGCTLRVPLCAVALTLELFGPHFFPWAAAGVGLAYAVHRALAPREPPTQTPGPTPRQMNGASPPSSSASRTTIAEL